MPHNPTLIKVFGYLTGKIGGGDCKGGGGGGCEGWGIGKCEGKVEGGGNWCSEGGGQGHRYVDSGTIFILLPLLHPHNLSEIKQSTEM